MNPQRASRQVPIRLVSVALAAILAAEPALTASGTQQGATAVVDNVSFENAKGVFTIYYDLKSDTPEARFNIAVTASATEGGVNRKEIAKTLSGDVTNVRPGPPRKKIVWQSGSDIPAFSFDSLAFELQATPVGGAPASGGGAPPATSDNKFLKVWLPIIGGGAVAGLFAFRAAKDPCSFTVTPPTVAIPPTGGTATVSISASPSGCSPDSWSVSDGDFVTANPNSGNGSGTVTFSAGANSGASRSESFTVAGQPVTVTQEGTCTQFLASPNPITVPATAGTAGPVTITANPPGCGPTTWTAAIVTNPGNFISNVTPNSGSAGTGFSFSVAANSGANRSGTIRVTPTQGPPVDVIVNQNLNTCIYTLSRSPSGNIPAAGATITITVTVTPSNCVWRGTFNPNPNAFLRFTNMSPDGQTTTNLTGNQVLTVTAQANVTGLSRTGNFVIIDLATNFQGGNSFITQMAIAPEPLVLPFSLRR